MPDRKKQEEGFNMKRMVALFMALMLMMAICPIGTAETTAWDGEISKVILTYATTGVQAPDMEKVQEAVNEMTRRDIGVEVEFMPISIFQLGATVPTKVISGETIDIFMMAFTGTSIYEQMNLLLPLNEYLTPENAPYLTAHAGIEGTYDDRQEIIYSVHQPAYISECGGFLIKKDDLIAAGLGDKYHDYDRVTLDDLTEIFAAIKAVKPDVYPCGIFGSATRAGMTFIWDALGDTVNSGVLVGMDSETVENYYESEPYQRYLRYVRDWYLKGYIPRDAATSDIGLTESLRAGTISGYFNGFKQSNMIESVGSDGVFLTLTDYCHQSTSPKSLIYFGVPVTAENPEAAVRFIDYMLGSADVCNTMTYGIEGVHWEVADAEHGYIKAPEGVDPNNNGYNYGFGFYMNRSLPGVMLNSGEYDPSILTDQQTLALAEGHYTKGVGAVYDAAAWTMQLQQIDTVVAQYQASLETGSADLDTVYPEFIAALKANGIDDVVKAKNAWFQEWLKQQTK